MTVTGPRGSLSRIAVGPADPRGRRFLVGLWREVWYARASVRAHALYRCRLFGSPWARRHARVVALTEGGHPRAGLVVFEHHAVLEGRPHRVAGIALVVADPAHRGRGLATRLVLDTHASLAAEGFDMALLFSDIDPRYYERLGYQSWPLTRFGLAIPARPPRRTLAIARATAADLLAQADLHDAHQRSFRFRIDRSRVYWHHLLGRARWRHDLSMAGHRPREAFDPGRWLALEDGRAVTYARCVPRPPVLAVTDAAHAPGRARALAAILADRARHLGCDRIDLVGPDRLVEVLGLAVVSRERVSKMMLSTLGRSGRATPFPQPVESCLWQEDWF